MNKKIAAIGFVLILSVAFNLSLINEMSRLHRNNAKLLTQLRELDYNFQLCRQLLGLKCNVKK
jgi:hypothetical protein